MRLQPIAMYVMITTVHSGLMIIDLKTCANFVLASSYIDQIIMLGDLVV